MSNGSRKVLRNRRKPSRQAVRNILKRRQERALAQAVRIGMVIEPAPALSVLVERDETGTYQIIRRSGEEV